MAMKRLSIGFLESWKTKTEHLPLLVRGARQVGKTWLIRKHAETYSSFVELNLEAEPQYLPLFREQYGNPKELIKTIGLLSGKKIIPGSTLLFIDEIQESPEALLSLRYFKENLPELHVIAAGSLLELAFKELSYPVGRIDFFHLFPMNFEEYLIARGKDHLREAIRKADEATPLPDPVHQLLLDEVSFYCLTGGMPEAVKVFLESGDLNECQNIQQRIIFSFREDFHKYASKTNIDHVRMMFNALPRHLGQKFKYSHVDLHIKSRELSGALRMLEMAGLAHKGCHTAANGLPLEAQIKPQKFKVFFLDVGLCHRILGLNLSQLYVERKELLSNRGAIAEQFVAQELLSYFGSNKTPQLYYWHREAASAKAEVDLITEHQSSVLPIEVKSRKTGSLKSLHLFLKEKERFVNMALKISAQNFSRHEKIHSLPFYALMKMS